MSLSIQGREIQPGQWEVVGFGFQGIIKKNQKDSSLKAFLKPLVEPFDTTKVIAAPTPFWKELDAQKWIINEIWERWFTIFRGWKAQPLPESVGIKQNILSRLRQYEAATAMGIIYQTVVYKWGFQLDWERKHDPILLDSESSEFEPLVMFLKIFECILDSWSEDDSGRLPPGTRKLEMPDIEGEATALAYELMQQPFFQAVFDFSVAVKEWLETTDLSAVRGRGETQLGVMRSFLTIFAL